MIWVVQACLPFDEEELLYIANLDVQKDIELLQQVGWCLCRTPGTGASQGGSAVPAGAGQRAVMTWHGVIQLCRLCVCVCVCVCRDSQSDCLIACCV
jgi:hypothetical protein